MTQHSEPTHLTRVMQRVDAAAEGAPARDTVPTGFPSVDKLLAGGLRRGDLVVLGGDVGCGKSALALAVAFRATALGNGVAFLCGEMGAERLLERALAIEGRVSIDDMRRGTLNDEARAALRVVALRLRGEQPQMTRLAGGMASLDDELRSLLDVELVVIDSLAAIPLGVAPQDEELAAAIRQLKRLAVETQLAILVCAPLAVDVRARADHRPTIADFGALGAVRQHADVVLALYREEQYNPGFGTEGGTELILLKNRNGATSYADLYFYKHWLRFEDMV
ncbi:MAG: DnaB-like helicase C-terminal domain-containing protein [Gemmatimonadota bacterium]|nr:DnaB-like helicase C-terminal domain-containing protein [Gemmatimonadota bacterium]